MASFLPSERLQSIFSFFLPSRFQAGPSSSSSDLDRQPFLPISNSSSSPHSDRNIKPEQTNFHIPPSNRNYSPSNSLQLETGSNSNGFVSGRRRKFLYFLALGSIVLVTGIGWKRGRKSGQIDVDQSIEWQNGLDGFDRIVFFGDSYTDNAHPHSPNVMIPKPPYWKGHWSNGPIWSERLPPLISKPDQEAEVLNFAVGGAVVDKKFAGCYAAIPDLKDQVSSLLSSPPSSFSIDPSPDPSRNQTTLISLWFGLNLIRPNYLSVLNRPNLREAAFQNIQSSVDSLRTQVELIRSELPQILPNNDLTFILLTIPRGSVPPHHREIASNPDNKITVDEAITLVDDLTEVWNEGVRTVGRELKQAVGDDRVWIWDGTEWFENAYQHPEQFGFKYSTFGCFHGEPMVDCENPDDYLWVDNYHPSNATSKIITKEIEKLIKGVN